MLPAGGFCDLPVSLQEGWEEWETDAVQDAILDQLICAQVGLVWQHHTAPPRTICCPLTAAIALALLTWASDPTCDVIRSWGKVTGRGGCRRRG